jgi:RHS repeat-associated protein
MEYDAHGRVARQINAEEGVTVFTYTEAGKLKTLTDPVGNTTSYVYDDAGRMLEETNELGKTRRFEYEGRLPVRKTDRNGRVTTFEYNDFGKPIAEKWLSVDGKLERTITSRYDALGKLEQVADLDSTHAFRYDELDRNVQTVMKLTGLEMAVTLENQFDEANRRTQVAAKVGWKVEAVNQYAYDTLGRVTGISQGEKRVEYAYNAAGQRTATSVFAGTGRVFDTLYQYDGMGRLTDLTHANGNKVFASYDYTWDIANRITGFDFTYLGQKDERTAEYGYDQTSQLVAADYNAFQPNEAYQYDANGNRKNFENSANNQLTNDGEFCYTYDSEGNRVEKMSISTGEKTKYVWDHRNRLTQVVTPKESVLYSYDYLNRMTRRNSEFVVHDGWQIVLTLDTKGTVKNRNLWGANQDELIATNGQFTLCDHLGSVRDVVDSKGKVVEHVEYNAFGKVTKQTGKSDCVFGYTGKLCDDETGLQWNINRWHDANVGRWISEDPIGFKGEDFNLYRFCVNAPTFYVDPNGLDCTTVHYPSDTRQSSSTVTFGSFVIGLGYTITQSAGSYTVCNICCPNGARGRSVSFNYSAHVDAYGAIGRMWLWEGLLGLGVLNAGVIGVIYAQGQGSLSFHTPEPITFCPPGTFGGVITACGESVSLTVGGYITSWTYVLGYSFEATIAGAVTFPAVFCASVNIRTGEISNFHARLTGPPTGSLRLFGSGKGLGGIFYKPFNLCLLGNC